MAKKPAAPLPISHLIIDGHKWPVKYHRELSGGANAGEYDPGKKEIRVAESPPDQAAETIVHELIHHFFGTILINFDMAIAEAFVLQKEKELIGFIRDNKKPLAAILAAIK